MTETPAVATGEISTDQAEPDDIDHDRIGRNDGTGNGPLIQTDGTFGAFMRAAVAGNRAALGLPPQESVDALGLRHVGPQSSIDDSGVSPVSEHSDNAAGRSMKLPSSVAGACYHCGVMDGEPCAMDCPAGVRAARASARSDDAGAVEPTREHLLDIIATAIARKTSGNSSDAIASDVLDDLSSSSLTVVYDLGGSR